MPVIDERQLKAAIKNAGETNVWLLFGEDGFLKDFYCGKLLDACLDDGFRAFNLRVFQDDENDLDEIFADAETLPMMAPRRVLLIRNYPLSELGKNQLQAFEKRLASIPPTSVLIFFYNTLPVEYNPKKPDKWTAVIDAVGRRGIAAQLTHRTPAQIAAALIKNAKNGEKRIPGTIGEAEALYLIEQTGADFLQLQNEFDKLCAYADGKPITKEMIDAVCVKTVEADVFRLSTAIFGGDADRAFEIARALLRQKTPLQQIMGALIKAYADLYRYKVASAAGRGPADFAEAFGYKYLGPFQEIARVAGRMDMAAVTRSLEILTETDIKSKSTGDDPAVLLTQTVAALSAVAAG